ncbi:MAG TPA: DUF1801 domain-containing protein [Gemmataceae bacterium]|jgi:hypothetical protein|nr:DUF1801 domain-containing protein [Gemmataceae bacterium]
MAQASKPDPAVDAYLAGIVNESRRADCVALIDMMRKASGHEPKMWGTMVGFGDFHYRYESGREGDTFLIGFASRKPDLTLYLGACFAARMETKESLGKLGKHKCGKGCLYLRRLGDVDLVELRRMMAEAVKRTRKMAAPRKSEP